MKKEEYNTKDKILDAAEKIFAEKGFDGTKVNEIAHAAQVNKAMLYYYYKDKDSLLYAVVERIFSRIKDAISKFLKPQGNTLEDLVNFLDFYIDFVTKNSRFVRIMSWEFLSGKHVDKLAREYIMPIFSMISGGIKQAAASHQIRDVSPEHTIFSVMGMNIFYIIASPIIKILLNGDPFAPERIMMRKEEIKSLIINGLIYKGHNL